MTDTTHLAATSAGGDLNRWRILALGRANLKNGRLVAKKSVTSRGGGRAGREYCFTRAKSETTLVADGATLCTHDAYGAGVLFHPLSEVKQHSRRPALRDRPTAANMGRPTWCGRSG